MDDYRKQFNLNLHIYGDIAYGYSSSSLDDIEISSVEIGVELKSGKIKVGSGYLSWNEWLCGLS